MRTLSWVHSSVFLSFQQWLLRAARGKGGVSLLPVDSGRPFSATTLAAIASILPILGDQFW